MRMSDRKKPTRRICTATVSYLHFRDIDTILNEDAFKQYEQTQGSPRDAQSLRGLFWSPTLNVPVVICTEFSKILRSCVGGITLMGIIIFHKVQTDIILDEEAQPLDGATWVESFVQSLVIMKMTVERITWNERAVESEWHSVWHLEATYLLVRLAIVEDKVALALLLIENIRANVDGVFFVRVAGEILC